MVYHSYVTHSDIKLAELSYKICYGLSIMEIEDIYKMQKLSYKICYGLS